MFACSRIASGSLIIEYCGEVISMEECYARLRLSAALGLHDWYMMELSPHTVIDARLQGNCARFINHGCDANAETQLWQVGSQQRIGIYALRDIEAGEEITYDYRAQTFNARGGGGAALQRCRCGADNCSGWLGEKPTTKSRKRGEEQTNSSTKAGKKRRKDSEKGQGKAEKDSGNSERRKSEQDGGKKRSHRKKRQSSSEGGRRRGEESAAVAPVVPLKPKRGPPRVRLQPSEAAALQQVMRLSEDSSSNSSGSQQLLPAALDSAAPLPFIPWSLDLPLPASATVEGAIQADNTDTDDELQLHRAERSKPFTSPCAPSKPSSLALSEEMRVGDEEEERELDSSLSSVSATSSSSSSVMDSAPSPAPTASPAPFNSVAAAAGAPHHSAETEQTMRNEVVQSPSLLLAG